MTDLQWDVIEADSGKLKDFKLDIEVGETQGMDVILAKFTTISSILDVAFVMAEEFNMILNFCSGVFELRLFYDDNGPKQATIKEVVLPVKYADFADVNAGPQAFFSHSA